MSTNVFQPVKFLFKGTCLKRMYIAILQIDKHVNKRIKVREIDVALFICQFVTINSIDLFIALFFNSFTLYC